MKSKPCFQDDATLNSFFTKAVAFFSFITMFARMSTNDNAPREHRNPKAQKPRGMVLVYTGNGKGKSTAGFGGIARALGHGKKVCVVQFIKGGWSTGEQAFFSKQENCEWHVKGDGFTWKTKDFDNDVRSAEAGWSFCTDRMAEGDLDLLVLDEINCAMDFNFLKPSLVIDGLKQRPEKLHVMLTGRGAPAEIVEYADLVSRMEPVKHMYEAGYLAQKGLDF